MNPQALPPAPANAQLLRNKLGSLALARPKGQPSSPAAAALSGKTFGLGNNDLGLQSVSFDFDKEAAVCTFKGAQVAYPISCGVRDWKRGATGLPGTPPRLVSGGAPPKGTPSKVAACGAWKDENTLELLLRYYETPHHDTITCRFDGATVAISFMSSIAAMSTNPKDKRPELHGQLQA
jgi:hypothetical protein